MNENDMILPEGFEAAAGEDTGTSEINVSEPAQPEAGLNMPEADSTETTSPGTQTPEASEQAKIKVKFNHEEKELGIDEAVPLIQKGMNYDKLQDRLNAVSGDARLGKYDKVMEVGKLLGYQTDDALLDALYNTYYSNTAAENGLTLEQVKKETELRQREESLRAKEQGAAAERTAYAMYEKLLGAFPDIKPGDIKPETWERVKLGADLTSAYVEQRNRELETKLKTMQQNMKNLKAAPVGSITAHGSAEAAQDPFLTGFESVK